MRATCECRDYACKELLSLSEREYAALAGVGSVVSPLCAMREGQRVLARMGERAVAVPTSPSVSGLVDRLREGTQWA